MKYDQLWTQILAGMINSEYSDIVPSTVKCKCNAGIPKCFSKLPEYKSQSSHQSQNDIELIPHLGTDHVQVNWKHKSIGNISQL